MASAASSATKRDRPCQAGTCPTVNGSKCSGSAAAPAGNANPIASGSCLIEMVSASANAKPRSTGRETNADSWPWRAAATSINTVPASSTSANRAWL